MSGFAFESRGDTPQAGHKLKWRERRRAYSMARSAYARYGETLLGMTDSGRQEAIRSVADDSATLDLATILLILKIAMQLWEWWNKNKVTSPPERPGLFESSVIAAGGSEQDE